MSRVLRVPAASTQGHQSSAKGHTCCICSPQRDSIPSSQEKLLHSQLCFGFRTWGTSATCRCCTVAPKTWSDSLSQSPFPGVQLLAPAGMAEQGCCGIPTAAVERGWHPGQSQAGDTGGGLEQWSLFCFLLQKCVIFWTEEQVWASPPQAALEKPFSCPRAPRVCLENAPEQS